MVLGQPMRAIGVFPNRVAAESALQELKAGGFSMDKISILAKDSSDRKDQLSNADISDPVAAQAEEGSAVGAVAGTAVGGLGGLLAGLTALAIPGVGPIITAGTVGTVLATALAGSGIGAASGGIVGAFAGLGVPNERANIYGDRISRGDYVLMLEGSEAEIQHAETLLHQRGIQEWGVFSS